MIEIPEWLPGLLDIVLREARFLQRTHRGEQGDSESEA
jgi:hypothetical protein